MKLPTDNLVHLTETSLYSLKSWDLEAECNFFSFIHLSSPSQFGKEGIS